MPLVDLKIEVVNHSRVRKGVAIACLGGALKSKWSDLVLHRHVLES